ncbi:hypothetical protein MPSEU_000040300 [Mayamaea pseudoterrestris]|nr:hypothetical protein MPSEU_000040300 [Mayamaea pseudoterrestris]
MKLKTIQWLQCLSLLIFHTATASQGIRGNYDRMLSPGEAVKEAFQNAMSTSTTINTTAATPTDSLATFSIYNSNENQTIEESIMFDKIFGGVDAQPLEAPYFVMMLYWNNVTLKYEFDGCGGSLVSDRHVLTAGHCGKNRDPKLHLAYVQAHAPFAGNPGVPSHISKIVSYTIHPDFDDVTNANDLSIVTLDKPVNVSSFKMIRLAGPYLNLWESEMVQVYGFGWTNDVTRTLDPTLQTVQLPYIPYEKCQAYYGSHVQPDMICAGYKEGGHDACNGDSGGPMIVRKGDQIFQVGVVSWGKGCGQPNQPGVYISVQFHFNWIQKTICSSLPATVSAPTICAKYNLKAITGGASSLATGSCTKSKLGEHCHISKQCCSGVCERRYGKWWRGVCVKGASL